MTDGQRRFISGLVQYYKPEKVLELGVSAGGGTIVLPNSLEEYGGVLYSVDTAKQFYRNPELPVGYCAIEKYRDLLNRTWHIISGQDPKSIFLRMLAPRLLLSTVCAEKYIPDLPSGNMTVSNIAAWQVNADTRKYTVKIFLIFYIFHGR